MRLTNYCSRCKATDVHLMKYSYNKVHDIQYHLCKQCNREKQRRYTSRSENKPKLQYIQKKSLQKYPEKTHARYLVKEALRKGELTKPPVCIVCRGDKSRIEGHHYDYSKPLDVSWLCQECHLKIHN